MTPPTTSRTGAAPQDGTLATSGNTAPPAVVLKDVQAGGDISIAGVTQTLFQFFSGEPPAQSAIRLRRDMLQLIENTWIRDFLLPSLLHRHRLYLHIRLRSDLVDNNQWQDAVQMPAPPSLSVQLASLEPDTDIVEVFRQSGQSLLIAGAPGAGKTTLLLIIAQAMLLAAAANHQERIPVVLNLVSWSGHHHALDGWLVEEMAQKYRLPPKLPQEWLENGDLLLLLDGLDEVQEAERASCAAAINEFRRRHFAPLVVCSRLEEYAALPVRLQLQQAVEVCPLTPAQIDEFLTRPQEDDAALARLVREDEQLRELATTPLMLYVISVAGGQTTNQSADQAEGQAVDQAAEQAEGQVTPAAADGGVSPDLQVQQARLWATYVEAMFCRRAGLHPFAPARTRQVLRWLAQQMQTNNQSIFLLEQMQPSLLGSLGGRLLYYAAVRVAAVLLFLIVCSILGLLAAVVGGAPLTAGLLAGAVVGAMLAAALLLASVLGRRLSAVPTVLMAAASVGAIEGAIAGNPIEGLLFGVVLGVPGALAGLALSGRRRLVAAETVVWSLPRLLVGSGLGLLAALLIGLITSLGIRPGVGLSTGWGVGFSLAPVLAVVFGLVRIDVVQPQPSPNQDIRRSLRNTLRTTLRLLGLAALLGIILAVAWGIADRGGTASGLAVGLIYGLVIILPLTLVVMLTSGGAVVLQHYMLRGVLAARGVIPWRFEPFLEYAAERVLLRRVGGGYSFYHRSLMEYFAAMEDADHEPK